MSVSEEGKNIFSKKEVIPAAIILSGFCWYVSSGLSGNYWWLFWLAPIPVLIISLRVSGKKTFLISFIAYLIGRLNWFSYLVRIATLVPAIIFTLIFALVFALIIIITRRTVIKSNAWYSVFAFPVFFTTFEFLLITFSLHGTAGSIAYSQSDFLPIIQIASITGILGITFMVTFIPAAIAVGWYFRREKIKFQYVAVAAIAIVVPVFLFGIIRISNNSEKRTVKVGLAVLEEKFHDITDHPDFQKEKTVTEYYVKEISNLAAQGAALVVLPERAINIDKERGDSIISMLSNAAKQKHVFIITGYTNFRNEPERNSALVIDADGNSIIDYNKVYLIPGLEHQFAPGSEPGLFTLDEAPAGTAICKDLDFPGYIKKYGKSGVSFLSIPAWDFVTDDWLHSRMAILRGVENGFSEVRTARLGRLTISDCYGRVTYEVSSSNGHAISLLGKVSLQKRNTIYTKFGDWFGIANIIAAVIFILSGIRKNVRMKN
ncbi:MAG: nitrilase-related carbon-nitrogen hydrolase [Ginsengibacter sp.]